MNEESIKILKEWSEKFPEFTVDAEKHEFILSLDLKLSGSFNLDDEQVQGKMKQALQIMTMQSLQGAARMIKSRIEEVKNS